MTRKTIKSKAWYKYAVAICIGVVLYVALMHIDVIGRYLGTFIGFFKPVIFGCVIAYIVSPLANLYRDRLFGGIGKPAVRNTLANTLAFITLIAILAVSLWIMIPQLIDSIRMFVSNLDTYLAALTSFTDRFGVTSYIPGLNDLESTHEIVDRVSSYVTDNMGKIISVSADVGKGAFNWIIALILSIYLLAERAHLKDGFKNLLDSILGKKAYADTVDFLRHCDRILNRYIIFNLIDAFIIAALNFVFMMVMGLPYAGLVSCVVGIMNLIPTFGPFIGAAIGALILVLVKPWYAGAFLLFTLIVQIFDGYILKPKLFGNSLGVSGLWVLVAIIVGGNMFGVIGILLGIPVIAILDDVYHEYLIPALRRRKESLNED